MTFYPTRKKSVTSRKTGCCTMETSLARRKENYRSSNLQCFANPAKEGQRSMQRLLEQMPGLYEGGVGGGLGLI